ncbi:MAG: RNA polymerase-binding protein DksA [Gammaproteobacteria bacterium]|nr:RNA polymerase-binding protein DksA [Gammaproteobacteria bacterium]
MAAKSRKKAAPKAPATAKAQAPAKTKAAAKAKAPAKPKAKAQSKAKEKAEAKAKPVANAKAGKVTAAKSKTNRAATTKPKSQPKEKPAPKAKAAKQKAAPKPRAPTSKTSPKTTAKQSTKAKSPVKKATKSASTPQRSNSSSATSPFKNFTPYDPKRGEHYMGADQLEHFRYILLRWRQELMEEVDRTVHHMQDEAANFPDPADRATQEEEFSIELRTRDRERKLIKKIDQTVDRIDQEDYGYCDTCGVEIGLRRLEARPTATQCVDCKTLDEIKERQLHG